MRLRDFLRDNLVIHGLKARTMEDVLDTVEEHLQRESAVPPSSGVAAALRTREEAHTTVLGEGVAVPHAMIPGLGEVILLVATTLEPVPFGPSDLDPVDTFFILLSPRGKHGSHIKLLARICRLVRHPGLLEELREAGSGEEVRKILARVDAEHV